MLSCKLCDKTTDKNEFKIYYLGFIWIIQKCLSCKGNISNKRHIKVKRFDMYSTYDLIWCNRCKRFKLSSFFGIQEKGMFGFRSYCKSCAVDSNKKYYKNTEKLKLYIEKKLKQCSICLEIKPLNEFYKRSKYKIKRSPACKVCFQTNYIGTPTEYYILKEEREKMIKHNMAWCNTHKEFLPISDFNKEKKR